MHPLNTQIGHLYKAGIQALAPASQVAGTRNGAAQNVSTYQSGTLVANVGAAANTPTTTSVAYALETSANGTDGWTPLLDRDGAAVVLTVTTVNSAAELDFNLQYATVDHAFLRAVETVAFTGGSTPAVVTGATLIFGGGQRLPL